MRITKRYGQSMPSQCPFCEKQATAMSSEGVAVCQAHKNQNLPELKCVCGEAVELRKGKHGIYFFCYNCGNVSSKRIFEVNDIKDSISDNSEGKKQQSNNYSKKEITITSDDADYFG